RGRGSAGLRAGRVDRRRGGVCSCLPERRQPPHPAAGAQPGAFVRGGPLSRATLVRLVALAVIWGTSFLLIKIGLEGLAPTQVVLARLTTGALALVLVLALRRQWEKLGPADLGHLAILAVVSNVLPFYLFARGEQRVSSGLAGVSNATTPLFTVALAIAVLPDERPTVSRVVGLVTGFLGAVV